MSGCGFPKAPILTSSTPVMGQPALISLSSYASHAPGILRITPVGGRVASIDDCHVFVTPSSFTFRRFFTDANGAFTYGCKLPTDPVFCGTHWVVQAVIFAPSGSRSFSASNALLSTLGI